MKLNFVAQKSITKSLSSELERYNNEMGFCKFRSFVTSFMLHLMHFYKQISFMTMHFRLLVHETCIRFS